MSKISLERLIKGWHKRLEFMYDIEAPFTINLAEQDVRIHTVKEKISGCFRTLASAKNFALLRSYLSPARKQGHLAHQTLTAAAIGHLFALGAVEGI